MNTDKLSQEEKNKSIVSGEFASEESSRNNENLLSQVISPESGEDSYFSDEDIYVEPPRNLSPGAVMKNRYELVEKIGEGGMGEVWKVHDKISEQDYALKFVPQGIQNAVAMKRVKATFNLISGLNHTNICPVRFLESDPIQGYFIVMDLLNGQTLEDLITDWEMTGGAPSEAVSAILRPVAAALDYAHNKKIIHRDIKPSNIFVNWNEETGKPSDVWIIDFGLAAVIYSSITRTTGKSLGTSGTRPYMSPEQWDGSPLQNAKTDQYALGVVAYEMYSGSWPFYNSDKVLFERFVLTKPVRLLPNVSDSINVALQKALAKKPEDRFDTCTDFIDALEGVMVQKLETKEIPAQTTVSGQLIEYSIEPFDIQLESNPDDAGKVPENTLIPLPELPERIVKLQMEFAALKRALPDIHRGTHPVVRLALQVVDKAKSQRDAFLKQTPKEEFFLELQSTIQNNPNATPFELRVQKPQDVSFSDWERIVDLAKQTIQAEIIYQNMNSQLEKEIYNVEERQKQIQEQLQSETGAFLQMFSDVFQNGLSFFNGYDSLQSEFPRKEIEKIFPVLNSYKIDFENYKSFLSNLLVPLQSYWENERPCVVEERRRLEKKEAERKAREKIEREKKEKEEKERKPGTRRVETVNGVDFAFRWCPAGTFMMGSPKDEVGRDNDETQHEVTLSKGFWMLETEVTQRQWQAIMGNNPSHFKGDNLPVECVSWNDCQEFCKKFNSLSGLQIGLPTEAQWEYACRAGTTTAYNFGTSLNGDKANCDGNNPCGTTMSGKYLAKTTPVGSYSANAWGLYDMHGNVWEWCSDWYGDYPSGSVTDPTGASSGTRRVDRGGSWFSNARDCRSAIRNSGSLGDQCYNLGFRPVFVLFVP